MELHNADTPKVLYTVYMLIFSLMSPIGIAIGIAVTSAMENETTAYILTTGVLQVRLGNSWVFRERWDSFDWILCLSILHIF